MLFNIRQTYTHVIYTCSYCTVDVFPLVFFPLMLPLGYPPGYHHLQLWELRSRYQLIQEALSNDHKLIAWHSSTKANLPLAAVASAMAAGAAAEGAGSSNEAGRRGVQYAADVIITAKVEVLEAKQTVLRQLVEADETFVPPVDYKVGGDGGCGSVQGVSRCHMSYVICYHM